MGVVRRVNEEEDGGAELWVSDRKRGGVSFGSEE